MAVDARLRRRARSSLALLGPIGFVRRFIRRFAIWAVPLALLYLTWWALDGADLGALWDAEGEGGLSVWQGADVVVGITVSWVPYAADYTRFSQTRRGALAGTGIGYFVPDVWLLALGAVLVLSRGLGDPAALPAAVVAGGFAAIVALFALLVTETDEAFANAYSAAVSLQNAVPRAPQELLIVLVTAIATAGALVVDFVELPELPPPPRLGLRAAVRGAPRGLAGGGGPLHARGRVRHARVALGLVGAWIAGFALYQWLYPTGPAGGWTSSASCIRPTGASARPCRASSSRSGSRASSRCGATSRLREQRRHDDDRGARSHHTRRRGGRASRVPGAESSTQRARWPASEPTRTSRRRAAPEHRPDLLPPLEAFGLPVTWHESATTTAYSFHYEGERRIMWQDAVGDPWTPDQAVEAAADATGSTCAR